MQVYYPPNIYLKKSMLLIGGIKSPKRKTKHKTALLKEHLSRLRWG